MNRRGFLAGLGAAAAALLAPFGSKAARRVVEEGEDSAELGFVKETARFEIPGDVVHPIWLETPFSRTMQFGRFEIIGPAIVWVASDGFGSYTSNTYEPPAHVNCPSELELNGFRVDYRSSPVLVDRVPPFWDLHLRDLTRRACEGDLDALLELPAEANRVLSDFPQQHEKVVELLEKAYRSAYRSAIAAAAGRAEAFGLAIRGGGEGRPAAGSDLRVTGDSPMRRCMVCVGPDEVVSTAQVYVDDLDVQVELWISDSSVRALAKMHGLELGCLPVTDRPISARVVIRKGGLRGVFVGDVRVPVGALSIDMDADAFASAILDLPDLNRPSLWPWERAEEVLALWGLHAVGWMEDGKPLAAEGAFRAPLLVRERS